MTTRQSGADREGLESVADGSVSACHGLDPGHRVHRCRDGHFAQLPLLASSLMFSEVLAEEFEVLESIYPTELTKLSERAVRIDIEPEESVEGEDELKLVLEVQYTDGYPDTLPDLSVEAVAGSLEEVEIESLLQELREVGEENLGMAMTFTLSTHLREQLSALIHSRIERRKQEEAEKERKALEEEEARTRGTPVTVETFKAWKTTFDKTMAVKKARDEEEKLKAMTPKEREEYKKLGTRLSGRQLFERDRSLAISDDSLVEEGAVSVDITQFDRTVVEEEEEEERMSFSDSD